MAELLVAFAAGIAVSMAIEFVTGYARLLRDRRDPRAKRNQDLKGGKRMYRQTDHPDDEIQFENHAEYPVATLEGDGLPRVQIIPELGAWTPVVLDDGVYRLMTPVEVTPEVQASIDWSYDFTLGIGGVPEDVVGVEKLKEGDAE